MKLVARICSLNPSKGCQRMICCVAKVLRWKSKFVCWLFQQAAPSFSQMNDGPFPLMYPDPCGLQLLMDDNYNIDSMIDWDEAGTVPCLEFSTYPSHLKLLIHRVENGTYNPNVLKTIKSRQQHYRKEVKRRRWQIV